MRRILLGLLVLASLVLAACGSGSAQPTEAPATVEESAVAQVTSDMKTAQVYCSGMRYSITGPFKEVSGECLKNEVVRFNADDEFIQGYLRASLSIFEGQPWSGQVDFDGVGKDLSKKFNMTCSGNEQFQADLSKNVTVTCTNVEKEITVTVTVGLTVLSTTNIVPAAPAASAVEWANMSEGEYYLFCSNGYTIKYLQEGEYNAQETYGHCKSGLLLNKLSYRVQWVNQNDDSLNVVTLYPDSVLSGYEMVLPGNLLSGRTYYVCSLDGTPIEYTNGSEYVNTIEECEEAVFLKHADGTYQFDNGSPFYITSLPGAFPSPRP